MQIEIIDISHSGSGVGKINGKVIFVPFTDVGEIVEVKNIKSNSKFDRGELEKVILSSKDRCEPFCPYFSKCGGCDFQFVSYERELEIKLQLPEFFKTSQELIDGGKVYERAFSIEYSTKNNIEDVVSSGSIF